MKNKFLITAAIALACTNLANAGTHGGNSQESTSGHSSGEIYDNMYVTLFAGVSMPKKFTGSEFRPYSKPENGVTFGGGVGYQIDRNFRAELTLQKLDIQGERNVTDGSERSKFQNLTAFANGYFDLVTFNKLTPYLTAGAGFVNTKQKLKATNTTYAEPKVNNLSGKSKNNFAWNIGAGFRHSFNDNITLDLGYKYLDFGTNQTTLKDTDSAIARVTIPVVYSTKLNAHTFNVGVAYNF